MKLITKKGVNHDDYRLDESAPTCERCVDSSLGIHTPVMERVWKPTGKPKFKGKGFYETDYKDKK